MMSRLHIKQFLTFAFIVMVFFLPQNTYAASNVGIWAESLSIPSWILFIIVLVLIAIHINYISLARSVRKNIKAGNTADMPEMVKEMLVNVTQSIDTAIIITDAEGNIKYINSAAEGILGYSKEEALNLPLSAIYDMPSLYAVNQLAQDSSEESKGLIYTRLKTKAGIWQDVSSNVIHTKNSYAGRMGTMILIRSKEVLDDIVNAAEGTNFDIIDASPIDNNIDMLTRLPARRNLFDYLGSILINKKTANQKYALMLINLDFFRSINNNLGYEVGDTILKECAERLRALFCDSGFLARMDGDEFALVLEISDSDDVEAYANKIFEIMKDPVIISTQEIHISVSIGISLFPEHGISTSEIISNAASSVNMVKNTRRGSYRVFSKDISRYNFQKFNIHSELRQALERKEFILHYQPKIDGKTNQIVGIEALIRWNHPEKGMLYPIDFIPVAEETGIIKYIDEWVLHTACTQLKAWTEEGINDMRLAVNLSAWQFKDQHLVETVAKVLADTGISPSLLELEITETVAIENINFTQNTLAKLIKMGVTISIDDFGTGYSSLNYLKTFPANFLKIDRSFIADIIKDANTYSIVRAIIDVAHALKLKVIAEGVENEEQLNVLNSLGCDEIQGYLISKPLTVEDIRKHMNI